MHPPALLMGLGVASLRVHAAVRKLCDLMREVILAAGVFRSVRALSVLLLGVSDDSPQG